MKDFSPEQFELELLRHKPARPPAELMERLAQAQPVTPATTGARKLEVAHTYWRDLWLALRWWLAPAAALLIGTALLVRPHLTHSPQPRLPLAAASGVKADDVKIETDLVNSFDTVVRLPTGEPVRYRCREFVDEVTLRDRKGGLVLEQRIPRVEVIPVGFETY